MVGIGAGRDNGTVEEESISHEYWNWKVTEIALQWGY